MSISIENYIKEIYKQSQKLGADTRPGTLADLLNVSNAAATDMARKLSAKKLINYTKYKQLTLTPEGEKLALKVIRKHRLWEAFLHDTLGLSLHEVHKEAESLEHFTSDFLADKIDDYLGNPSIDPHGDPIPDSDGNITRNEDAILLSMAEVGKYYRVSRLFSSDEDFFDFCRDNMIEIGTEVLVEKQYRSNKITEIEIDNKKLVLSHEMTNLIYVK